MPVDARGFQLVGNVSQSAGNLGSFVSQKINERLQQRALGGEDTAMARLSSRDPRAASQIGSILQGEEQKLDVTRQREQAIIPRIAQGYKAATDKTGFLQQTSNVLRSQGFDRLADDVEDDIQRYATDPTSVDMEYEAGLAAFTDPARAQQLTAAMRERQANLKALEGARDESGQLLPRDQLTVEQEAAAIDLGMISRATTTPEELAERERQKQKVLTAAATDRKFKEQLGSEGAKVYARLQEAGRSASEFIPRLKSLRSLASKINTGTGAEIKLAAKKALGIDSADMEELNAKLGELAQDILNQQTGTKTDFDFQNAVRQSASLGKSKEANVRLIEALLDRQLDAVSFADQARDAFESDGVKGVLDMRFNPTRNNASVAPSSASTSQQAPQALTVGRFTVEVE